MVLMMVTTLQSEQRQQNVKASISYVLPWSLMLDMEAALNLLHFYGSVPRNVQQKQSVTWDWSSFIEEKYWLLKK